MSTGGVATASSGDVALIQAVGPIGADQATFDLAAIPQTFRSLMLVASLRSDLAGATDFCRCLVNNDAVAADYDGEFVDGTGAVVNGNESLAALLGSAVGLVAGNTALAGSFGQLIMDVVDYANATKLALITWQSGAWGSRATTNGIPSFGQAACNTTAAINRLVLRPNGGALWKAGSSVALYGRK